MTWDCGVQIGPRHISISWPYVDAKTCSSNHCYIRGRVLRPEARQWRDALAMQVRAAIPTVSIPPRPPVHIYLSGHFLDYRACPDLSNLHKLIGDAVEAAIGINDREFLWQDLGYRVGGSAKQAFLRITVKWGEER